MSTRRAIQACRFLRPPSFVKRATLREKPRVITGPFENPVRRFVRLREKARAFCELPPPRKIPVAKPVKRTPLKPVEGVPTVDPEVLQRRLDFLLSDKAIEQQLMAPLRAGRNPYQVEADVWERQMLEIRKIYRAQYLQKLAEVTEQEKKKEQHRFEIDRETRKERKMQYLAKIGEDKKRRAILQDRLRVERKVNEIVHMARVSKLKKRQLYWLSQIEKQAGGEENIVTGENLEKLMPLPENQMSEAAKPSGNTFFFRHTNHNSFVITDLFSARMFFKSKIFK